ncbi:MAG: MBL fold metallo-hydrolase [Candidatus Bipolaricaulota bacterium]|nr:MAG: MBL fold metallo-hydrolase [Candidatus Bipolaricaulota bacterium]
MYLKQFRTGGDRNFGYVVADDAAGIAAIIDPSFAPEALAAFVTDKGWTLAYSFCTHDHPDHTNGNAALKRLTGSPVLLYGAVDAGSGLAVVDGSRFPLGGLEIVVLHTPGHTEDSICLLVENALFTGDTLFVGKVGGTGFGDDARAEYASLHEKLLSLPDGCRVFPGHDYGVAPESTIGHERETNPFLLQPDFEAFVHLKRTWTEYKKAHGIA